MLSTIQKNVVDNSEKCCRYGRKKRLGGVSFYSLLQLQKHGNWQLFGGEDAVGDTFGGEESSVLTKDIDVPDMGGSSGMEEPCLADDFTFGGRHREMGAADFGSADMEGRVELDDVEGTDAGQCLGK